MELNIQKVFENIRSGENYILDKYGTTKVEVLFKNLSEFHSECYEAISEIRLFSAI